MNIFLKSLAISSLTSSITLIAYFVLIARNSTASISLETTLTIYLIGILCGTTINYIFIKNGKLR